MLTPLDLESRDFEKVFRGYSVEEVDDFIRDVNRNYERLYRENLELKDKLESLSEQMNKYDNLEDTLKETLVVAQTTAEDVVKNANNKADLIVEDAKIKADEELNRLKNKCEYVEFEYSQIFKDFNIFKNKYVSFLESQVLSINEFYESVVDRAEGRVDHIEENNEA